MSYPVTRTITSIISGTFVLIMYLLHVISRYRAGILAMDEYQSWAQIMLIFIGIGIAVAIVTEIVFHILFSIGVAVRESIQRDTCNEKDIEKAIKQDMVEDEMAKIIDLKSMRVGYITAGSGFVASLIFLVLDYPVSIMINILFVSFLVAAIIEALTRLYYYKKGI